MLTRWISKDVPFVHYLLFDVFSKPKKNPKNGDIIHHIFLIIKPAERKHAHLTRIMTSDSNEWWNISCSSEGKPISILFSDYFSFHVSAWQCVVPKFCTLGELALATDLQATSWVRILQLLSIFGCHPHTKLFHLWIKLGLFFLGQPVVREASYGFRWELRES